MISSSMDNSLIFQVFTTMEYGPKNHQSPGDAQQMENDNKNYVAYIGGSLCRTLSEFSFFHEECCVDIYERHLHLKSLAKLIIKNNEFIADEFMKLNSLYSRSCIVKLIEELIQHITYFAQHAMLSLKDKQKITIPTQLACYQSFPLRCLSSFVIPILANGYLGVITTHENNFLYLVIFAQLCEEAGFQFGSLSVVKNINYTISSKTLRELFPRAEVEMLIFEDSDLHAAIDCIVDAIWNMAEKNPNLLVNILVQESIYLEFKDMLKHRMLQYAEKPIKYIIPEDSSHFDEALNEYKSIMENGLRNAFEVFQVEKSKSNMPAIILFNNQIKASLRYPIPVIGVDVFRTESEALTMCNNNIVGQIASVWVESGSSAHRIANELQVQTVWINGFDLVHPITSHLSLPQDSIYQCMKMDLEEPGLFITTQTQQLSTGQDVHKSWKCAEKSVLNWMKCKTKTKILESAYTNLVESRNDKYKDFLKILSFWASVPALSSKVVSTDEFNIEAITQPRGIICIELIEKLPLTDCVYAITASIAFGNCVLVSSPADLYQDLIQWSQCCNFPEGVINIFKQCSPDSVTSIECTSILLSLVKFTLWSFREDLNTNSEFTKLFSKLVFSSELNCLQIKDVQTMSVHQIEQISTRPKFVWFPNQ